MNREIYFFLFLIVLAAGFFLYKNLKKNSLPTTFYIVRHGQTDWNAEKRIQGIKDIPLNDTGRRQSRALSKELASVPFNAYYSSDLGRAYETAQIMTESNPRKINIDKRLRERDFGSWEGRPSKDFYKGPPETRQDTESDSAMTIRIFESLNEIAKRHPGETILIASHGGVIRNIIVAVLGHNLSVEEIEVKNGSVLQLVYLNGKWSIKDLSEITLPSLTF